MKNQSINKVVNRNMRLNNSCKSHERISTNTILRYIRAKYPQVVNEAVKSYRPLKYPIEFIDRIVDTTFSLDFKDVYKGPKESYYTFRRTVVVGVVYLLYRMFPNMEIRSNIREGYLHNKVCTYLSNKFEISNPNTSYELKKAISWLSWNECFRKACAKVIDNLGINENPLAA